MAHSDRLGAILPALATNVLGRIAGPYDQDVLVFEFNGVAEIMRVQNAAFEAFKAREMRDIWCAEVTCANDHMIKFLGICVVVWQVTNCDFE